MRTRRIAAITGDRTMSTLQLKRLLGQGARITKLCTKGDAIAAEVCTRLSARALRSALTRQFAPPVLVVT